MNKIFLLPTDETKSLLESMFSGGSMTIDWDSIGLELGSSESKLIPGPYKVYRALPGPMGVWYDAATARSYLILPLIPSPEMAKRHEEIGDAWGRDFLPFLSLTDAPSVTRKGRAFINSLATGMVDRQPVLTFHNETLVLDESTVPSHRDFYFDYQWRGAVSNQVFVDLDRGLD